DHDQPDNPYSSARTPSPIPVIASAAPEQQHEEENQQDQSHGNFLSATDCLRSRARHTRGVSWRNDSMAHSAAKGSFQAVKLQRPARTTVCSHSKMDMPPRVPSNQSTILTRLNTSVCPVVDSHEDLVRQTAPARDARAKGTTIHRHDIDGGLLAIFFSRFGLRRRPLVRNATHFSSIAVCKAMLPGWTLF